MLEIVIAFAVGIIVLALLAKLITLPLQAVWKLITNSIVGVVILWVVNLFGAGVQISILNALIAGIFGVPGVVVVLLMTHMG